MVKSAKGDANGKSMESREKRIPIVMLSLLFAAFAGALGLKAYEDYRVRMDNRFNQEARASETLAAHIRAELVSMQVRLETMLQAGARPGDIRELGQFSRVQNQDPGDGGWAQLSQTGELEIFAQAPDGRWATGARAPAGVLPELAPGYTASIQPVSTSPSGSSIVNLNGARAARSCTHIAETSLSVCLSHPAPIFGRQDIYSVFIYLLLLLAPALAVTGLVLALRRTQDNAAPPTVAAPPKFGGARPVVPETTILPDFEVAGLVGFWKLASRTHVITLGEEAAVMLGAPHDGEYSLEEFLRLIEVSEGRNLREALSTPDPLKDISVIFSTRASGKKQYFELMGAARDGDFSGALLNVTDRVQAKLRSRLAEVIARTAIDAHPGPFAVWDSRKRLTHWNSAFLRDFNLEKSALFVGASYDFVMSEVARFVRVERPLGEDSTAREMYLISGRWIRLLDRRTSSNGMITVGLDISSLKHQEASLSKNDRKLRAMVAELQRTRGQAQELARRFADEKSKAERASQAKSVFLASMSHELRTPLNAINGFSEMIASEVYGALGDNRYKGYAQDILESGQHLLDMINDILDMAKIEAGKMQISPRPIDPSDAVDAAVRLIRRRASDKKVSLSFDPDDDLPEINGDHLAIKQMSLNLISNAIKFTPEGGRITVTVAHENEWIAIRVTDTGVGISAEDLPRLAQPFEQAASADGSSVKGTGLGLALTKSFAEMHGGRFAIESELGVGTTVSILLPVPRPQSDTDETEGQAHPESGSAAAE